MRWFLPQIVFYGIGATIGAILNIRGRFGAPMVTPVLNNLVVIAVAVVFIFLPGPRPPTARRPDDHPDRVLGAGTTLGVVAMTLALLPSLRASGFRYRPRLDLRHPGLRQAVRLGGWVLVYVAASQVSYFVVTRLATGPVAFTTYSNAYQLFQLPHAIIAVSLITALLPRMSSHAADERLDLVRSDLSLGLRMSAVVLVPAALGLFALARPLAVTLFAHHATSVSDATPYRRGARRLRGRRAAVQRLPAATAGLLRDGRQPHPGVRDVCGGCGQHRQRAGAGERAAGPAIARSRWPWPSLSPTRVGAAICFRLLSRRLRRRRRPAHRVGRSVRAAVAGAIAAAIAYGMSTAAALGRRARGGRKPARRGRRSARRRRVLSGRRLADDRGAARRRLARRGRSGSGADLRQTADPRPHPHHGRSALNPRCDSADDFSAAGDSPTGVKVAGGRDGHGLVRSAGPDLCRPRGLRLRRHLRRRCPFLRQRRRPDRGPGGGHGLPAAPAWPVRRFMAAEASLPKGDTLVPGSVQSQHRHGHPEGAPDRALAAAAPDVGRRRSWAVVTESGSAAAPS